MLTIRLTDRDVAELEAYRQGLPLGDELGLSAVARLVLQAGLRTKVSK